MKTITPGTILEYTNHAGKHTVEYLREIPDGAYSTMIGKWNGFDKEVAHACFRFQGVIQSNWKVKD